MSSRIFLMPTSTASISCTNAMTHLLDSLEVKKSNKPTDKAESVMDYVVKNKWNNFPHHIRVEIRTALMSFMVAVRTLIVLI